ncbi:MAG: hypothetical protein QOE30_3961 [Mycobacterium sp.]|jgi:hypothetical protein|nr:hypothetical protein [Mycobacterium sp.]
MRRGVASSVDLRGYWTESVSCFRSNIHCLMMIRVADLMRVAQRCAESIGSPSGQVIRSERIDSVGRRFVETA